jgi:hypothetical protein
MQADRDRQSVFEDFMAEVSSLLVNDDFRKVLRELDAEEKGESVEHLLRDPVGLLSDRGVELPREFNVSAHQHFEEAEKGTTTTRYCLRICAWGWCIEICVSRTTTTRR